MTDIATYVGNRIRFFRKLNGMSIAELAEKVNKGKSTLSKYENGRIIVDIQTLSDIADVLHVDIAQFFLGSEKTSQSSSPTSNLLFHKNKLFIYYYDGRKKDIVKSFFTIQNNNTENVLGCTFYMDVPNFENYEDCMFYYVGEMHSYDLVTYTTLINQINPMERLGMCILNPFQHNTLSWGMMFGISYKPIAPFALKFLISNAPLKESDLSRQDLIMTQNELHMMKSLNMMLLNQ